MRIDDENAIVLFEAMRWCCLLPLLIYWRKERLVTPLMFLGPILFVSDASSMYGLQGLPKLSFLWGLCPAALFLMNRFLWDAVRQLIVDAREKERPSSFARSVFAIACFGLFTQYAEVFSILGLRDTASDPIRVTHNIFECAYFTVMTWTTVGYGDLIPAGPAARFFAAAAALNGYVLLACLIAFLIPVLSSTFQEPTIVSLFDFERQRNLAESQQVKDAGK